MRNLGQKTERRILKKIGARRQPRSGGIPGFPNDGIKAGYLIEVKSTETETLRIKKQMILDLEDSAIAIGKVPALILVFNLAGTGITYREFVAIPRFEFEMLTKDWRKS